MSLSIKINGEARDLPTLESPVLMSAVIKALDLNGDRIAVELNGALASRRRWESIEVSSGDRLEIVHFVGGGLSA